MKFLLVLLVLVLGLWLLFGRKRLPPPSNPGAGCSGKTPTATMVACARCGLNLPQSDAVLDDQGRSYCGQEHRDVGPR